MRHEFEAALLAGLSRRPRRVPCRFLYDHVGSALFERIAALDCYYPARAETALLAEAVPGAGAMRKSRQLLAALPRPAAYVPVDVAAGFMRDAARRLAAEMPDLAIQPVVADFTRHFRLPPVAATAEAGPLVVFFPGSTIGNLAPPEATGFLARMAALAGRDGWVMIGVDPVRDPGRLLAAYDDAEGVTAAFMRNLLVRANRECGAGFRPEWFDHRVEWNLRYARVEHRLVCRRFHQVSLAGRRFSLRRGEAIEAEHCHKYSPAAFRRLAAAAGLRPAATWMHRDGLFSLHLLRPD